MKSIKNGILFDLDGTLWDAGEGVVRSWNYVLEKEGYVKRFTVKEMKGYMGLPMDEIGRRGFASEHLSEKEMMNILEKCMNNENEYLRLHGGVLYPHLEEVLDVLHKEYFLAVVSNCQSGYIEAFLEYHRLEKYFDDRECFGSTGLLKDKNISLVAERNDLEDLIYIGDVQGDLDAADLAGYRFVHASYGYGTVNRKTEYITDLTQLQGIAKNMLH